MYGFGLDLLVAKFTNFEYAKLVDGPGGCFKDYVKILIIKFKIVIKK